MNRCSNVKGLHVRRWKQTIGVNHYNNDCVCYYISPSFRNVQSCRTHLRSNPETKSLAASGFSLFPVKKLFSIQTLRLITEYLVC